jgi:4-carboxymuconolactone decarboxylase
MKGRAMADETQAGLEFFRRFVGAEAAAQYETSAAIPGAFGAEMFHSAIRNVFGGVWSRPGLDARSRSLLTLGMVIAMRLPDEITNHARGALKHGCTHQELEEVVLHCAAYVGFPAAGIALKSVHAAIGESVRSPARD